MSPPLLHLLTHLPSSLAPPHPPPTTPSNPDPSLTPSSPPQRWNHHLRPDIKKDAWTEDEERRLVQAHTALGNRWSDIARQLPGEAGPRGVVLLEREGLVGW
jgi:hypothetical protein